MKLSVVIPAFNEQKYIGKCLDDLIQKAGEDLYEIIVVDNASTDKTAEIAKTYPNVRVVREAEKGLTKARQRGFSEAKGDLIAFIDADTRVTDKWVHYVKKEFSKNRELVCLSSPYRAYDLSRLKQMVVWSFWNLLAYPTYVLFLRYMVSGTNFVIRKKALEAVGGFDATIQFYGEDTDIARRLAKVGKVKFFRKSLVRSSGRRLEAEGILRLGTKYTANFVWEVVFHRPYSKMYRDWR